MPIQRVKKISTQERGKIELKILKPDPTLPRGYLSKSAIEMYLRCPKQFEYHYILGKSSPPAGVALVEGSSHGEALNMNNLNYIAKKENIKTGIVIEKFKDEFSTRSREIEKREWITSGETVDSVLERGEELQQNYFNGYGKTMKPISVERQIEVMMGGVPVLGFIDVEQEEDFWDYKVVKSKYSDADAKADLQFSIYAKAIKKPNGGFVCLTKTKDRTVVKVPTDRTLGDIVAAEAVIKSVAEAIRKGSFPMCNPKETFPCSEKFCGFWRDCRGKMLGR